MLEVCYMELGDNRTESEILADLHLRYPLVNLGRRNGVSGNAHLTTLISRPRTRDPELS